MLTMIDLFKKSCVFKGIKVGQKLITSNILTKKKHSTMYVSKCMSQNA